MMQLLIVDVNIVRDFTNARQVPCRPLHLPGEFRREEADGHGGYDETGGVKHR